MLDVKKVLELKDELDLWCKERKISLEAQQDNYISNILDKIGEYISATDNEDRVVKLCDITLLSLSVIDKKLIFFDLVLDMKQKTIAHILEILGRYTLDRKSVLTKTILKQKGNEEYLAVAQIVKICENMARELGYDLYLCMKEKILEINSYVGEWNSEMNKFVKLIGCYSYEEAERIIKEQLYFPPTNKTFKFKEETSNKYIFEVYEDNDIIEEIVIVKFYNANMSKGNIYEDKTQKIDFISPEEYCDLEPIDNLSFEKNQDNILMYNKNITIWKQDFSEIEKESEQKRKLYEFKVLRYYPNHKGDEYINVGIVVTDVKENKTLKKTVKDIVDENFFLKFCKHENIDSEVFNDLYNCFLAREENTKQNTDNVKAVEYGMSSIIHQFEYDKTDVFFSDNKILSSVLEEQFGNFIPFFKVVDYDK